MLSALHWWYITLTGFDPYSPCDSGEKCSLTGLKIGRAAFSYGCTIRASPKKKSGYTRLGAYPLRSAASHLLEQLAA
jgi:hypothetical protein